MLRNSLIILWRLPLIIRVMYSCHLLNSDFFWLSHFDTNVSWCGFLWVHLRLKLLILILLSIVFSKFEKYQSSSFQSGFFTHFSLFFYYSQKVCIDHPIGHTLQMLSFIHILFLFGSLSPFQWLVFGWLIFLPDSSLLNPHSNFINKR
jgi:hypothetical protein